MSEFGALNLEDMAGEDARLKEQGGSAGFLDQFVPMPEVKPGQTGSVTLRILPPVKGGKLFQYNRVHTINERKIHCPRPLVNGKWDRKVPCPICDYYASLWRQIDKLEKQHGEDCPQSEQLKEEARSIKPIERYYYNAIVRSMLVDGKEQKNVGPRILSIGKLMHQSIITAIVGRDGDAESKLGNVTDLKNGWDFVIRKTVTAGEGFPKYDGSAFSRNPSPAGTADEIKKWQEGLHDLTKLRNPKDYSLLEKELAIHRGLIADESEGFNTDTFDAKWRKSGPIDEEMEGPTRVTKVTVPTGVPTNKVKEETQVEPPKVETSSVEDEAFLKELADLEG